MPHYGRRRKPLGSIARQCAPITDFSLATFRLATRLEAATIASTKDRRIVAVLFFLTFLYSADNQIIAPLLPAIRSSLDTPITLAGFWGGAYHVAAAISALALAPLSDRRGRRIFLWGGSLLFGVASLACSMAWDFTSMLMFRFLVGFAGGIMSMSAQALVGDHFPHARRGSAMGTVLAGRFLGLSLGVVIGILFAQWLGWPVTFLFIAVIAFFSAWPAWRMIPQVTPQFHQSRSPLQLYRQLLSDTPSLYTVLVSMFNSAGLGGFLFFIGIWLEESFGFALWQIATVFVLTGMLSFGGSLVSGRYADRYGRTLVIRWGNLLCALAFVVIPLTAGHFWLTGVFFAILSLAVALWMPPLHTLVTELAPASARGSLVALKNAAALVGIACAQSIGGYLYDSGGYVLVGLCSATLYIAGWALVQWKIPETIA